MRAAVLLGVTAILAIAGCGGDEPESSDPTRAADDASPARDGRRTERERPAGARGSDAGDRSTRGTSAGRDTAITVGDSEFGSMLFGSDDQAIYIFENDGEDEPVCYGQCADAWPPVLTEGKPGGKGGVDDALLGTAERRDGTTQVTYDGQPLYFYAHEQPGEVRCHNVNLNGGFWWAVAPDGERLPAAG